MSNGKWEDIEFFDKLGTRTSLPIIRISKERVLSLSAGFLNSAANEIKDNKFVELYYSKSNNAILLKFTNGNRAKGTHKLMMSKRFNNGAISFRSFANYYHINAIGKLIAKLEDVNGLGKIWAIYLNELSQ